MARVAAIQMKVKDETKTELNMASAINLLKKAGEKKIELACLPELFLGLFTAEPIPGPCTDKIGKIAKEYNTYIVMNMFEMEDEKKFNTSILIDRSGDVIGKYRKTHLFPSEPFLEGDSPGSEYKIFKTDFTQVGMIICNDANFPETVRILTLNGAELICCSTRMLPPFTYPWKELMVVRSLENQVFIISAGCHDGAPDTFIVAPRFEDPILAEAPEGDHIIISDLNLDWLRRNRNDSPLYHVTTRESFFTKIREVESQCFIKDRNPSIYQKLIS